MITNISAVATFLESAIQDFTDIAVVGVSGGVDSATIASMCVSALGKENVYLVSMPYDKIDTSTFNKRSSELALRLGAHHFVVPIKEASDPLASELRRIFGTETLHHLTVANIRPRVRMNILYSISGELGYNSTTRARVMGTGHLSEDLIGYDTKGGDALCDIFVLSELVKSEVYQLAEYYDVPESIRHAAPSAGLYPGQTDEQELGYSYTALEPATLAVFRAIQDGVKISELHSDIPQVEGLDPEAVRFVIERFQAHFHKHQAPTTVAIRHHSEWFK